MRKEKMHRMSRHLLFAAAGLLALSLATPSARAEFQLLVTESGGPTIPIVDDGPLDTNTTDPGVITVNTSALNALLVDFAFTDLGAESNRLTGTPFSNDVASLSQSGTVLRSTLAGTATITIVAADNDYNFPAGNPKDMTTAASDTFRFTTAGDSRSFQGLFDPTNSSPPSGGSILSPLLAFIPPIGPGPFGTSNPGVVTALGTQPLPFGLANRSIITLGSSTSAQSAQRDQFAGATSISSAVPEPASFAMVGIGLGCLGLRLRARRRAA